MFLCVSVVLFPLFLLRFATLPWNLGFLPVLFRGKSSAGCCMIWRCATLWSPTSSDKSCIRCFKLKTLDLSWLGTCPANFATYFPAIPIIDLFFLNLSNWSKCFSPNPTFCLSSHHCLNVPEAPEASVASISRDPVKKAKWRVQFRSTWNTELQSNFIHFHTVPLVFEVLGTTCFDLGTAWSLSTGHRATWNAGMEGRGTAAPSKQTERFTQSAPPTSPSDFFSQVCFFGLQWHKCHLCAVSALPGSLSSFPLEVRSVPAALRGMVQSALPVPWEPDNLMRDFRNLICRWLALNLRNAEARHQKPKGTSFLTNPADRMLKVLGSLSKQYMTSNFHNWSGRVCQDKYFGVQLQVTTNDYEHSIKSSVSHCFPSPLVGFGVSWRFTWCVVIVLHTVDLRQKQSWRNWLFCWFCSLFLNCERFICQALIIGCSYFESSETWAKAPLSSDARKQFGSSASKNLGAKLHKSNSRRCILALSLIFPAFDSNFLGLAHSTC